MQHHRGRHFILHMKKAGMYETVVKNNNNGKTTCERKSLREREALLQMYPVRPLILFSIKDSFHTAD